MAMLFDARLYLSPLTAAPSDRAVVECSRSLGVECPGAESHRGVRSSRVYLFVPSRLDPAMARRILPVRNWFITLTRPRDEPNAHVGVRREHSLVGVLRAAFERPLQLSDREVALASETSTQAEARFLLHELLRLGEQRAVRVRAEVLTGRVGLDLSGLIKALEDVINGGQA